MLREINNNEEQYIKARLDELPSWVNKKRFVININSLMLFFFL